MRLLGAWTLGVKDAYLARRQVIVRRGKSDADRLTLIPEGLGPPLREEMAAAEARQEQDLGLEGGRDMRTIQERRVIGTSRER